MVDPRRLRAGEGPPAAVVVQVRHDGRPVRGDRGLRLSAGHGDIEFHYTAPALMGPERVLFQYMLQGLDEDWHGPVSRRVADYANLAPGSYTFRVRAGYGDGAWGEATSFGLTLEPHFYERTECRVAALLAAAAMAALAYHYRTLRRRARRELIVLVERSTAEARASQQAAEQANRAKDRFLAVLSHELRTPLTPVLLAVDAILDVAGLAPEAREHLEMMGRNIALEARLVDDLLDISRIGRGQLRLELRGSTSTR